MEKEFLNPKSRLLNEVVLWLCGNEFYKGRIKNLDGAHSLSHILVVVPTAQSARNLRFALAKEAQNRGWGGILPPKIVMPNSLLEPTNVRVATEAEELSILAQVLIECEIVKYKALFPKPPVVRTVDWALDMASMILGVKSILAQAGLLISEVEPDNDIDRWHDLTEVEKIFIDKLKSKGVVDRSEARRLAISEGCNEDGVEEIVLPSALDIQSSFIKYLKNSSQDITILIHANKSDSDKFDEWGRPTAIFGVDIGVEMIESLPTALIEADEIAKYYRSINSNEALPALVVCDAEMHPELEGAFQNYFSENELLLRNPSKELLSKSSLGRLLSAIIQLSLERDYDTFSTLVRMGDIARWAKMTLSVSAVDIANYVGILDSIQNKYLPRTIDEVIAGASLVSENAWNSSERKFAAGLKLLAEAVKVELSEPITFIKKIFSSIKLDEKRPMDRELIAAAKTLCDLRDDCASNLIAESFRSKLFKRLLKSAFYTLEPTAENVLPTIGWLEVAWCSEDELVIAGFNEGCVPENIVGHPFVPDSLRKKLDITTNADREARDSFIFTQAVLCRANNAVSVFMHQISGDKNVMKPSRILFNGIADYILPSLTLRLYAVTKGSEGAPTKELPSAWRLKLPFPPKEMTFREKISVTSLDQYIRCPFKFYLQEVLGSHSDDRNLELDPMAFGNLCHLALEQFAKVGPKDSSDSDEIAEFLANEVHRQIDVFGMNPSAIITLQGEAAIARLKAFSVIQAARRREGWRIVSSEQNFECRIKSCPTILKGKVDRIDCHEKTGEIAIIDYKTWRRATKEKYENSMQLPIYRAMVESSGQFDVAKARSSKAFYCIIAERPEDVKFDEENACHEGGQSQKEDEIINYLTDIAKGIFYPAKNNEWENDYSSLIWQSPDDGIDIDWLNDQTLRREGKQ